MNEILKFISSYKEFSLLFFILNIILANGLLKRVAIWFSYDVKEAGDMYGSSGSLYEKCRRIAASINIPYKWGFIVKIIEHAKSRLAKCGVDDRREVVKYILLMYGMPGFIFVYGTVINFPNLLRPLSASLLFFIVCDIIVRKRIRRMNLMFINNAYKIYKYLYNQVTSGVRVTDAIKSVYEIADNKEIRKILINLAAKYELTLDIDESLKELRARFKTKECETLCTALKLGVATGDNSDILHRQEDIMFKKYFAMIQAETDERKLRSMVAAGLFSIVIIILITIPLLADLSDAIGSIFIT